MKKLGLICGLWMLAAACTSATGENASGGASSGDLTKTDKSDPAVIRVSGHLFYAGELDWGAGLLKVKMLADDAPHASVDPEFGIGAVDGNGGFSLQTWAGSNAVSLIDFPIKDELPLGVISISTDSQMDFATPTSACVGDVITRWDYLNRVVDELDCTSVPNGSCVEGNDGTPSCIAPSPVGA